MGWIGFTQSGDFVLAVLWNLTLADEVWQQALAPIPCPSASVVVLMVLTDHWRWCRWIPSLELSALAKHPMPVQLEYPCL